MNDCRAREFQLNTFDICFKMIKINEVALIFISFLKSKIGSGKSQCLYVIDPQGDPIVSVTIGSIYTLFYLNSVNLHCFLKYSLVRE